MKNHKTLNLTVIGLMTAIMCILGPLTLAIPISPVPISLTTLAIYLTAILLGMRKGSVVCLVYLLIGFVGIPVFSAFTAGPGKLLGPTGGYLIGYVIMALIIGFFVDRYPEKMGWTIFGILLGTLVMYGMGTAWLAYTAGMTFSQALFAGVIPFIPGDLAKIIVAMMVAIPDKKRLIKSGLLK